MDKQEKVVSNMETEIIEWIYGESFDTLGVPDDDLRFGACINRYHARLAQAIDDFNYPEIIRCIQGLYRQSVMETMEEENLPERLAHILTRKRLMQENHIALLFI